MVKTINTQHGFTLLEVMIAMTIFAVFIATFVAIQGNNLRDSSLLREEETLQRLCLNKINEIAIDAPSFQESLTLTAETKTFEHFPNYQYTVTYKHFDFPDMAKLQGTADDEFTEQNNPAIEKKIFEQVKKIFKEALWQVEVKVENKETKFSFTLSRWLRNPAAKVELTY